MSDRTLREYQRWGADEMARRGRVINADAMGVGKTLETLEALRTLAPRTTLIVSPKMAYGVWRDETRDWLDQEVYAFSGDARTAYEGWQAAGRPIMWTNFEQLGKLLPLVPSWDAIIIDEAHKLRNRQTLAFKNVKALRSNKLFLLTGSPVVSRADNLWALLNLIDPKQFQSYWSFVNTWLVKAWNGFGYEIAGVKADYVEAFRRMLLKYMIRRTKESVLSELPPKTRRRINVQLTAIERRAYNMIANEFLTQVGGEYQLIPSHLTAMLRLRQFVVDPRLCGFNMDGSARSTMLDMIESDFDADQPVVIFTPFVESIDPLRKALINHVGCADDAVSVIKGGMSSTKIADTVHEFNVSSNPKRAIVISLRMSTSYNLTSASIAYFYGLDWTPDDFRQAEDRLHRIGQRNHVEIRYLVCEGTIDDHQMDVLDHKTTYTQQVFRMAHDVVRDTQ